MMFALWHQGWTHVLRLVAAMKGKGDYKPAPRITEADKTNDRRSLQRALDRRLYLLLYGTTYEAPSEKPVWHFPEKVYNSEEALCKKSEQHISSFKRCFFKSQAIATNKFNVEMCEDFVWVTKDELLEYFPEQAEFLNKMIIS
ncbi:unnamed protein product [Ilex paraguariensis]|uniref:Ribosomal protein L46 N-terminal domain-containing protein n=1 Tax=Ilex paraguariensis TaxID=185542 RepID=A0ABC8SL04_9AQUA